MARLAARPALDGPALAGPLGLTPTRLGPGVESGSVSAPLRGTPGRRTRGASLTRFASLARLFPWCVRP